MRHRISSALVSVAAWLAMLPASPFAVILCRVALHHEPPPWTPLLNLLASAVVLHGPGRKGLLTRIPSNESPVPHRRILWDRHW